ncbi:MAG: hypothetical protein PVI71_02250 [Desulfobacterales bacterium]|jgi:hypothetical protein
MQLKNSTAGKIIIRLVFFSMVLAFCQGLQTKAAAQDRIPLLQGGPHAGSWESNDVLLEYQYVAQQSTFKLNIGGKAKRGYDQLTVWIVFFDEQGKVLRKKSVLHSGFRQNLYSGMGGIEKTLEIPINSTQFTFQSLLKIREGR